MLYPILVALARLGVRWHYRDVSVHGLERVPREGATLVAVNHPNALVDVLVVGSVLPRRLTITAKSTLFVNPLAGRLLRAVGVLPLQRASDLRPARGETVAAAVDGWRAPRAARSDSSTGGPPVPGHHDAAATDATDAAADADTAVATSALPDPARNAETFRAVIDELARGGTVLIFPEGKSHDDPRLAPLRTGAARMAMAALETGRVPDVTILPVGLTFERKEALRSRVHMEVGEPIRLGAWQPTSPATAVAELTALLAARLADVTLNYEDVTAAARDRALARFAAATAGTPRRIGDERPLAAEVAEARRVAAARDRLAAAHPETVERAAHLVARVDRLQARLDDLGISLDDLRISTARRPGARFALREGALLLAATPAVLWARVHHWLPFRLARAAARTAPDDSRDQPAMRTIVAGLVLVLAWYGALGTLVWRLAGPLAAALYVASLPLAADLDLRLRDRLHRARRRVHAYRVLRRDPTLQRDLVAEVDAIRAEGEALEAEL